MSQSERADDADKQTAHAQQEKQHLLQSLEQAAADINLLRHNYELQVTSNTSLREEIKSKDEQFKQKMAMLE